MSKFIIFIIILFGTAFLIESNNEDTDGYLISENGLIQQFSNTKEIMELFNLEISYQYDILESRIFDPHIKNIIKQNYNFVNQR